MVIQRTSQIVWAFFSTDASLARPFPADLAQPRTIDNHTVDNIVRVEAEVIVSEFSEYSSKTPGAALKFGISEILW